MQDPNNLFYSPQPGDSNYLDFIESIESAREAERQEAEAQANRERQWSNPTRQAPVARSKNRSAKNSNWIDKRAANVLGVVAGIFVYFLETSHGVDAPIMSVLLISTLAYSIGLLWKVIAAVAALGAIGFVVANFI